MWVAVTYRNDRMASVQVSVYFALLIPQCCVEALYRLDVPKFIYFK